MAGIEILSGTAVKLTDEQLDTLRKAFRLSPRETQVLALLFEGLPTNQDIADRLRTTSGAIQAAVRTLCAKTGARSRHELITICLDSQTSVPDDKLLRASFDHLRELEAHVARLEHRIARMEGRED